MNKMIQRKDIRLKNYNYSQAGYYFVTICTKNRQNLLWNTNVCVCNDSELYLSPLGFIVDVEINKIAHIYLNVKIDKYVIMPNHIHIIVVLHDESGRSQTVPTISRIIKQFKGSITKKAGFSVWQKSYYDHIIRNESEYLKICEYIEFNPLKWNEDKYYIFES